MTIKSANRFETHSHSMYSNIRLLDCINRPEVLLQTAVELGYSGLTITDHEALCGHVDFILAEKSLKEKNIIPQDFKLGLGNEIYLTDTRDKSQKYYHFILIAKNNTGHRALKELSSRAWYYSYYDRGMERVPTLKLELEETIKKYPGSVIATTACLGGELPKLVFDLIKAEKNKNEDDIYNCKQAIVDFLSYCQNVFGDDFYIEVAPGKSKDQITYNKRVKGIAEGMGIKMIFATDAHYPLAKDRFVHKMYLNSKQGDREVDEFYAYAHLMDNEEAYENLKDCFSEEEFCMMCAHTIEIMNKVEGYDLAKDPIIPTHFVKSYPYRNFSENYPVLKRLFEQGNEQERYWVNECYNALVSQQPWLIPTEDGEQKTEADYLERLEIEADVISTIGEKLGNCLFAYFNTFQHYIDLFWECGSLSGPGRGSSVCFLSNYLLGITQLDPIRWGLMYWRFLNKERVELPDIDTDLSPSKRKLIFKKIREEIGETNLLQVATFGTEGTRSAIQTACRGYRSEEYPDGIDNDVALYLSGLIPQERGFLWSLNDVVNGNKEKDRKPIQSFIKEVEQYPGLLDIMMSIEGLVNKRGQHASGVILYNETPFETNAIMRSPNGDLITQFALHESEFLGDVKFDFLVTEVCDKLTNAIMLLKGDHYFDDCNTLREIYEKYFHPSVLNLSDERIWSSLAAGDTIDVFQFNSDVGLQAAKSIHPVDPIQMTMANALMRLMGEKGKERPIDRYVRLKNNMNLWYKECERRGLSKDEVSILEKYYLPRCGTPALQEDLMLVCLDENIANFTLAEANQARKIVAKKQMEKIPELKRTFITRCPNQNFGEYVWETTMGPQMGYAFALPHSLAYSFVGIQTLILANCYPSIYWNCACLITNSGGNEDAEEEETIEIVPINEIENDDDAEYEDLPDRSGKKKKVRNTNYGKISTAIGQMAAAGIKVAPPDINKSLFTFVPDAENNTIIYGIKGITRIGADIISAIMKNRPFTDIWDFLAKVKVNKPQMVNLIKSGAFDCFGRREDIMYDYIESITDKKQRLTLQNMAMLIRYNLIPEEQKYYARLFEFNKYLKANKANKFVAYVLDATASEFYDKYFDADLTWYEMVDNEPIRVISQIKWDSIYKKEMDGMRAYLKEHKEEMLNQLNTALFNENWIKYCQGTLSKWEMDSIGFYYHEHELANLNKAVYETVNFYDLPADPKVDRIVNVQNKEIPLYKIYKIAGTVISKNKNKNSISLLTTDGVVNVKIYQAQFAKYDRQISEKDFDGKKHVIEKSWFTRGNKLLVMGIRRDDTFQLKKYKNTKGEVVQLITGINEEGMLTLQSQRYGE